MLFLGLVKVPIDSRWRDIVSLEIEYVFRIDAHVVRRFLCLNMILFFKLFKELGIFDFGFLLLLRS